MSSKQKRLYHPELTQEQFKRATGKTTRTIAERILSLHVLPWGGIFRRGNYNPMLINTCTFDNMLYILYVMHKETEAGKTFFANAVDLDDSIGTALAGIKRYLDAKNYDKVKTIWLESCDQNELPTRTGSSIAKDIATRKPVLDCFGAEDDYSLIPMANVFPIKAAYRCRNKNCENNGKTCNVRQKSCIAFSHKNMDLALQKAHDIVVADNTKCSACQHVCTRQYGFFEDKPLPVIYFHLNPTADLNSSFTQLVTDDIVNRKAHTQIKVFGKPYELFAFTVHHGIHFHTVFNCPAVKYDGFLNENVVETDSNRVSTLWYIEKPQTYE